MKSRILLKAALVTVALCSSVAALAQGYDRSTIRLAIPNGSQGFSLGPAETGHIQLPRRLFVHKVMLQVDSANGNSGAELIVNGDRKGNTWLTSDDPLWVVTVEQETSSIQVFGLQGLRSPQGRFVVRSVSAVVSETDDSSSVTPAPSFPTPRHCVDCDRLPFPSYYRTVMGNVSNRAIILVDRLAQYTNYRDFGAYLLPVKKAAAEARSVAEARGDASQYAAAYYSELLYRLDNLQPYFSDTFERGAAFELGTELLSLREHIRDILD
ncbi:MAG: hypothetical protein NTV34_21710 [Proteobacteria bacterium]|nr:hypothetical protein [Pseudomonadota bacterium]